MSATLPVGLYIALTGRLAALPDMIWQRDRESVMPSRRLAWFKIARLLDDWPPDLGELAVELRNFVLATVPDVSETSSLKALSYYKDCRPSGVIGGNVCLIASGGDCLHLAFIHGASIPDPKGLLLGAEGAKRYVEIRCRKDIRRNALRDLLLAAEARSPTAE